MIGYFAKQANISPAVIFSMSALSSFIVALVFYFLYKERLSVNHIIGMLVILVSVVLVPVTKAFSNNTNSDGEPIDLIKILIPISFAMLLCACFAASALV